MVEEELEGENLDPPVRKKEYIVLAEHEHWDFLKGSGPSAPPRIVRVPLHLCTRLVQRATTAPRSFRAPPCGERTPRELAVLRGISGALQQTEPDEDKRGWKPGWKSVRPMAKIDPHRPSYETEDRRVRPPSQAMTAPLQDPPFGSRPTGNRSPRLPCFQPASLCIADSSLHAVSSVGGSVLFG